MSMSAAQIRLPSPARGTKHTCGNDECGRRFYDLNRSPLDCPYCGVAFDGAAVVTLHEFTMEPGKRTRSKHYKLTAPVAEEPEEAAAPEAEADSDEATDDADTPNILIEDDEADATTDDVIEKPHGEDESS